MVLVTTATPNRIKVNVDQKGQIKAEMDQSVVNHYLFNVLIPSKASDNSKQASIGNGHVRLTVNFYCN